MLSSDVKILNVTGMKVWRWQLTRDVKFYATHPCRALPFLHLAHDVVKAERLWARECARIGMSMSGTCAMEIMLFWHHPGSQSLRSFAQRLDRSTI